MPETTPVRLSVAHVRGVTIGLAALAVALIGTLPASGSGDTPDGLVSPLLQAAMDHPLDLGLAADEPLTVWVYFRDKGVAKSGLDAAVRRAEEKLSPRTLARRRRAMAPDRPVVDGRDLPVASAYLGAVEEVGGRLRHTSRWLNAASFRLRATDVERVSTLPMVERVDLVRRFRNPLTPKMQPASRLASDGVDKAAQWTLDYGLNLSPLQQVQVPAVHEMGVTGRGIVVGMLDTGFRTTHEALAGVTVLDAYDFVGNDSIVGYQAGDATSAINHGTMTLSTLAGYMPGRLISPAYGVSVLLARTEDVSQEVPAEEDNWVAGLEWAEARGADIISSSLGYIDWYTFADLDGNTAVTTIAADLAAGRGLVVVNSAGNNRVSTNSLIAPADADSVITVGAVDLSGTYTSFSSPGPTADGRIKPDVMALGLGNPVANPTDDHGYGFVNGTSFSCPLTAGVAALMLSRVPGLTPLQVLEALRETASQAGAPDNNYGWGVVDALAAVTYFGPMFQTSPLGDTDDTFGPYPVTAVVTDRVGVDPASVVLNYRVNEGSWNALAMSPTGNSDEFGAAIPGQGLGSTIEYSVTATGTNGFTTTWPAYGTDLPRRFQVTTIVNLPVSVVPDLVIPMDDPAGVSSVITLSGAQSGIVVDVSVDVHITHPDIGELTLLLTSPSGTEVTLHLRTDAGTVDLVGNYPQSLTVDGPGSLSWFHDETSIGPWTLTAIDALPGSNGVIDSWGLNFVLKDFVSAGGRAPAAMAVLHPNSPNPFNPKTRIAFDLAVACRTQLSIFDLRGMVVRRLLGEVLDAGPHSVVWDGRDGSGREVGSGVYLYLLETPFEIRERKMLLVR